MHKRNNRNPMKRFGVLVLCLMLTLTFCLGTGSAYVFAQTPDENEAVIVSDEEAPDFEVALPESDTEKKADSGDDIMIESDDEDGSGSVPAAQSDEAANDDEVLSSDDFETVSDPAEGGAQELSASFADDEIADKSEQAQAPAMECITDFSMDTLIVGYTQAEADAQQKDIIIKNTGNVDLEINPQKVLVSSSTFVLSRAAETVTIKPGESAAVGSVKPRHQLKAGIYEAVLEANDTGYKAFIQCSLSLIVLSRTTEIFVKSGSSAASSLSFGPDYPGYPKDDSNTYTIFNNSNHSVRFGVSSDSSLFKTEFIEEGVTSETLFAPGESTEVNVSLNTRKAASLKAGIYKAQILFTGTSEDGISSCEFPLPAEYTLLEKPCWASGKEVLRVPVEYISYSVGGRLNVSNTEGITENKENYLMAEFDEGEEFFDISLSGFSSLYFKIKPKETLTEGIYTAKVELYFDPEGRADTRTENYCGTCQFTLYVTSNGQYDMEIANETDEDDTICLGMLTAGYTETDAEGLRTALLIKNTGRDSLNVSSRGLAMDQDAHNFLVRNEAESQTIASNEIYDKIWIQPKTGLEPGLYTAEIWMYDDDGKAETDSVMAWFVVTTEGLGYKLECSGGIFEDDEELGEDGLDFGIDAPDTAAKTRQKYVRLSNTGSVTLQVTPELSGNASGVFSFSRDNVITLKPGEFITYRIDCNPTGVSGTIGVYTASLDLELKNANDSTQSVDVPIPLKYEIGNIQTCKLTLDFQGKGGPDYPDTTIDVVKGSAYSVGLSEIMHKLSKSSYEIRWPTDDEYTMLCLSKKTDAELAELGTWEAALEAQNEIVNGTVEEDTTVYLNWARKVRFADLSVDVPSCGEAIPDNADVRINEENAKYTVASAVWSADPEETSFIAGNKYGLSVKLTAEFGYAISPDCECTINDKAAVNITLPNSTRYSTFETSITAKDHDPGDWYPAGAAVHAARCSKCHQLIKQAHRFDDGEEVIEPTCTTLGKKVYTCLDCGYEKSVIVPALGHKFINKTLVTEASDTEMGVFSYQCANCKETFEETFFYRVTEGNNTVWYRDSNKMVRITFFRNSTCFEDDDVHFDFEMDQNKLQILLDDRVLKSGEYSLMTTNNVETEVGLYADGLNQLSDGEHTLTFLYEDGMRTAFINVKTPTYIDNINISIDPPVCGDSAKYGQDKYGRYRAVNAPVITLPDNCHFTIAEHQYKTRWTDANGTSMWEGTFTGGETAYAAFWLEPDEGYAFPNAPAESSYNQVFTGTLTVNGVEVTPVKQNLVSYLLSFIVPVEAVHNISDASYKWTKDNSTVTATGTCSAEGCKAVVTEKVKTTSKVTKAATYTATGFRTYTAVFKNPVFEKQTKKVTIPKKEKRANTLSAKGSTKSVSYAALQKKSQTVKGAITVTKAKGTVTYAKTSGSSKIKINSKTGVITVNKGLKKGKTYTITVKVTAAGTSSGTVQYKKGSKTVKVNIKVK